MKTKYIKILLIANIFATSLFADQILLENAWANIGYSNAKDAMVSGATTASGKGYSALYTNPAGLSTNYAVGVTIHASSVDHQNATGSLNDSNALATTKQIEPADDVSVELFYNSLMVDIQPNIHKTLGYAYGLETDYGLFSLGMNYVMDDTDVENYQDFGTGDYYTLGFQWQKSFINIEDFYGLYFGFSKKGQGIHIIDGEQVAIASAIIQKIGFAVETNVFSSTILVSLDLSQQSWNHISDTLDTQAIGIKYMMFDGFTIGLGYSKGTYNTEVDLSENTTMSAGVEIGLWKTNIAIAALSKEVLNKAGDVYSKDDSLHIDISFAF